MSDIIIFITSLSGLVISVYCLRRMKKISDENKNIYKKVNNKYESWEKW